jgi:hypothetical protein
MQHKIIVQGVANCTAIINYIKMLSWGWFIGREGRKTSCSFSDWWSNSIACMLYL